MDISYILNHLGEQEKYEGSVIPPIVQTSNFAFKNVNDLIKAIAAEKDYSLYTRGKNPTIEILAKKLAALEGAEDAMVFSSGNAAITTAIIGNCQAGDHIICVKDSYSWTTKLLTKVLSRFGVEHTFVDGCSLQAIKAAKTKNTKILYLESPTSIRFDLQDISKASKWARQNGIITVVDNSYATPLSQKPLEMGADIVVHSATKYLGGHSDVIAGALCGSREMIEKLFYGEFLNFGGTLAPFNAWLLLRSLRTLKLRVDQSSRTTPEVVKFLENHPKVKSVLYPFATNHHQYDLAKKQMKQPMGMFSAILKTKDTAQIEKFCNSLNRFLIACSWGGHESLVFPACSFSWEFKPPDIPSNLIRFYIGLEDAEVLITDLDSALRKIH